MLLAIGAGAAAFVAMEPVSYASHRWVMHGVGWALHRSHHRRRAVRTWRDRFEANDWFPVAFAGGTILAMAAGTQVGTLGVLVPIGVGVTAYGAAYGFVHDLYIHGRLGRIAVVAPLERLREAHAIHHRLGGEPYGMLCPVVPRELRLRQASRATSPATATASAAP